MSHHNDGQMPDSGPIRNRFPTLFEVLSRKTVAPLDLFSFYIYMRDQQRSVDYLDFWLDVSQHLQLCRLYVRRLHRSMIEETPDMEKNSKRSSFILENAGEGPSNEKGDNMSDQRLSAFLRSDRGSRNHSPQNSQGSNQSRELPQPGLNLLDTPGDSTGQNSSTDNTQPRREDLRASAEKILYTYLLPGSEREIIIPQSLLADVQEAIEGPDQRSDPELFDHAKDYVFQAMERDAYPGFLQNKGLGNLVPQSMLVRLIVGLISFFAAMWASFILIFLDKSRSTRCWWIAIGRKMSGPTAKSKRGPTVLMTDARDAKPRAPQRPAAIQRQATSARLISVDNILQYASDIPSQQQRGPPGGRPMNHTRTPSGRHPLDPRLTGRLIPQHMPTRSSKLSEKLVLLPETEGQDDDDEKVDFNEDEYEGPPTDEELARRTAKGGPNDKSYAERLPKAKRTDKLSRVTAYCTAQAYKMKSTAEFVKDQHHARTKLYDDCLYTVYHLPLLPGSDGYRVRSSPALKSPGGKTVLDEEIERNEQRDHHEGYFGDEETYYVRDDHELDQPYDRTQDRRDSTENSRVAPNALTFGEMFVFSYGVAVFWNFTEKQEKDILADLTFSSTATGISIATRPLTESDFETEEFHFEYNPDIPRPRVYNDMITLKSGDHMIKLAMSHAIAQSTKLSLFEEGMNRTMLAAQYVPKRLALTGKLGMRRTDVVKMIGQLFTSRVDVNLSSNMLDTPNFFWDAEPTLHPLYTAVREYLEIKPRIQVLNERCQVFLDLGEILSDSISDKKMTKITWIIIVLIVLSICITCLEVLLRFAILQKGRTNVPVQETSTMGAGLKAVGPPAYAGPALLAARSLIWVGGGVKGVFVG
ncbi:sporulation RMD8 [Pyrenophora seminiperda CCB06]|uniref:Sporulation RMD8 n=1 Tax=Pyrenophora seminiperda CCB06 TaxID=1302712 RepID=A0A3M7LYZ5_9PLEO|nr:sporulation RMD8 [Pyrenophora seminiperda CCB06]